MSEVIIYNTNIIPDSITNPQVDVSIVKDNIKPFSFLEFITLTHVDYSPEQYNQFYLAYLKEWTEIKQRVGETTQLFSEIYINFLKEITLTFTTKQEQRFLNNLDFTDPADLDVAIPFFTEKIRQVILFYKEKRDDVKFVIDRNKQKGTRQSLEKIIFEKIYEYVFSAQDSALYQSLGLTLSSLKTNLKISIDEFVDVYGNYFDIPQVFKPDTQAKNLASNIISRDGDILSTKEINNLYFSYNNSTEEVINKSVDGVRFSGNGVKIQPTISSGVINPTTGLGVAAQIGAGVVNNTLIGIDTTNAGAGTGGVGTGGLGNIGIGGGVGGGTGTGLGVGAGGLGDTGTGLGGGVGAGGTSTGLGSGTGTGTGLGGGVVAGGLGGTGTGLGSGTGTGVGTSTSAGVGSNSSIGISFNPNDLLSLQPLRDEIYTSNINAIDPRLYFPDDSYAAVFGSAAFLQDLPLLANIVLQYDPVCDPANPIDLIRQDQELKDGIPSDELAELKRKLISKYIGVDFHYIDTTGTQPVTGILFKAEQPWANIPNLQLPNTPTTPAQIQPDIDYIDQFVGINGEVVNLDPIAINNQDLNLNNINNSDYNALNGTLGFDGFVGGGSGAGSPGVGSQGVETINVGIPYIGGDYAGIQSGSPLGTIIPGTNVNNSNVQSALGINTNNNYIPTAFVSNNIGGLGGGLGAGGGVSGLNGGLGAGGGVSGLDGGAGGGVSGLGGGAGGVVSSFNTKLSPRLKESVNMLRNIGLFFKPDKTGLFQLNSNNSTYSINPDKLTEQKIYIFPDPAVYGNVSINSQPDYPIVFIEDYRSDVATSSLGFAQGDPLVSTSEQTFTPYYAREQNIEKTIVDETSLNLNFSDLYNRGYITKVQYDIYGNEYALFKDQFGQTFREISEVADAKIVNNLIDGHVFYDVNEGYNFNYNTDDISGSTIRTGISALTVNFNNAPTFTLSGSPLTLYFREFLPYQDFSQAARNIAAAFRDGGRFTFLDSDALPDPLHADEKDYPSPKNYFYSTLAEGGLARTSSTIPTFEYITDELSLEDILAQSGFAIETEQTNADFTINVRSMLSSRNVEDYDCGYFTDDLTLTNDYKYGSNYYLYDVVAESSKTKLSPLSSQSGYLSQTVKKSLEGKLFVKNQAHSLSLPLSTSLSIVFNKYSQNIKAEIYHIPKDFDVVYDTIIIETENYLIFDKIHYVDNNYSPPSTKNTVFKLLPDSPISRFSNRFFNEEDKTITFCIVSPFMYMVDYELATTGGSGAIETQIEIPITTQNDDGIFAFYDYDDYTVETTQKEDTFVVYTGVAYTSAGNNKALIPSIYQYNIKDNTYQKLFPLDSRNQSLSTLFSLQSSFTEDCNFNIVGIHKPQLVYNSYNDTYKITFIGVDNNNLFHLFDYAFFINNNGDVEFESGKYFKHDKTIRTSDFYSTSTVFLSSYSIIGTAIINNGSFVL